MTEKKCVGPKCENYTKSGDCLPAHKLAIGELSETIMRCECPIRGCHVREAFNATTSKTKEDVLKKVTDIA